MFTCTKHKHGIAAFMLALALLAGCGGADNGGVKLDPKNPVTIVVWHYYHGAQKNAFDDAVLEFNETLGQEQGIIAETVSHGGVEELADNVLAAANGLLDAGPMPDIFGSYGDTALTIKNMGLDTLANYIFVASKQLGQDLAAVEDGHTAINLDEDIMWRLWRTYYEPAVTGSFAKLGRFCSDDIKTGDILCYIGSTSSASYFPAMLELEGGTRPVEMIALPMPVFEGGVKTAISQGSGMVIAKTGKEKEYASAMFLKWFTEPERSVPFAFLSSYLPVKKEALEEPGLSAAFEAIDSGGVTAQNVIIALEAGIEQLNGYGMYTCAAFEGGREFRVILPQALENAAKDDRAAFLEMTRAGADPSETYALLEGLSRAKFDNWLRDLSTFGS